jgi:ABC-type dipeptide/oligopeptide/nickel transport system ATPase component
MRAAAEVDGASLQIARSEALAVGGPPGSRKSTVSFDIQTCMC